MFFFVCVCVLFFFHKNVIFKSMYIYILKDLPTPLLIPTICSLLKLKVYGGEEVGMLSQTI